ncbi:GGDEF domain-containing protein [Stecheria sp. CLA-KB-P133]|uniref:GGDEF domain-containing protein n=1 Tax=Grylomicrobium aquisgranensis TaxID=2926318 RepID=A0AB35U2N2_9FIRM|nr:GGDEF domain-containing protein [Lactimicrobium massiliense]MDX8419376.1 GGDEF domain-containing protein [Stecheria sp. CLA-KB-P133]MDY3930700.1 GGDEF domain-containing protein [Erysipelotrichaceae bacterium]MDD6457303.1 GGDEF domain-containing protein [Lactimicrobium massiliense]MDD6561474.1 GGDEF domain-containing protein [Lactimicrobium massiliense]MDD6675780.1 GGDEF domain-containing protein [Lactimicrobium massiliense]
MNRTQAKSKKQHPYAEQITQIILLLFLIGELFLFLTIFHQINGTSKVINYAGIVRGCSQRVVKLEMADKDSDDLIRYLDEILDGLENGGSQYHLTRLKSSDYQDKLQEQKALWADIKNQIISLREDRSEDNGAILLQESEDYYSLCDETVSLAQSYSQSLVRTLNFHEIFIVLDLAIMSVITLHRYWLAAMTFRRNSAMEKQMYDDPLTGIYNRKYYESRIKYSSGITDSSIVYIDLDHLKYINDNYGHNTGDEYLKKAVIHLKNSFRTSDLIIRMGGDEFLVILKGCRLKAAEIIMDKALSSFRQTNDTKYPCSFSYGISYISDDGTKTVPQAIAEADMKMYACKKDHQIIRGE